MSNFTTFLGFDGENNDLVCPVTVVAHIGVSQRQRNAHQAGAEAPQCVQQEEDQQDMAAALPTDSRNDHGHSGHRLKVFESHYLNTCSLDISGSGLWIYQKPSKCDPLGEWIMADLPPDPACSSVRAHI